MKRRAERTPEEQQLCDAVSECLRRCRHAWDRWIDLCNAQDRLVGMRPRSPEDLERLRATREVMGQTSTEIHQLEAQANRLLLKLGERPIRGLGR